MRVSAPFRRTVAATAQPADVPRRVTSSKAVRRKPRPGVSSEIASSRLVLPAPFAPVSATSCEEMPRLRDA